MKKIRVKDILANKHSLMNDIVTSTAGQLEDAYLVVKIDDLLKERGITQKDLAQMTGIRAGTISELINGKGVSINKTQLFAIMVALRVTKMSDIYEVVLPIELLTSYEEESREWKNDREMPVSVKEMYRENLMKATGL